MAQEMRRRAQFGGVILIGGLVLVFAGFAVR
jgi:hypothetical protein